MKVKVLWKEKMFFSGEASGFAVPMDARSPIGSSSAPTPKELVALGLAGCTAMDVAALMKKHRQPVESMEVAVNVQTSEGRTPSVFQDIEVVFQAKGAVDKDKLVEAVHLSQTQYCGVSEMLANFCPVHYRVELNGEQVGKGEARFKKEAFK
ncbi:MAG: osmotically inducible protein OsmC [Bdellovibrio sp.]|nr:MAG: osmotically inducible protein OsmC [Bdellovibrio sp.]